jgi:hypothetical protein
VKSYFPQDIPREKIFENEKKKRKVYIEESDEKEYLDIWDINPSFRDIHSNFSLVKAISLLIIMFLIIVFSYFLSENVITSIVLGIIGTIMFIAVFHDELYFLRYLFAFIFHRKVAFNPFEDFIFWYEKEDPSTLFISNRKELINIALRIFQVDVIPENVHSAVHQFIKRFSAKGTRLSYSYQIVQKPIIPLFNKDQSREIILNSLHSRVTSIYFTVFYRMKGILSEHKLDRMKYYIKKDSIDLKSNLVSNFHHFKATLLSDIALINAIRTLFTRSSEISNENLYKKEESKRNNYLILEKLFLCALLIFYIDFILFSLKISILYLFLINIIVIGLIIFIWWRALLFQFTKSKLLREDGIITINPFKNISFYRIKRYPCSLFLHIDNQLLIGMKIVNLKYVYKSPFCLLGKFIENLNNHKINFSYTLKNEPLTYYEFYRNGLNFINEKNKVNAMIQNGLEAEAWLGYRYGMWYSTLTMSIYSYQFINSVEDDIFKTVEDNLIFQIDALKGAFKINFQSYMLEDLRSNTLISGYLFTCMKNNIFSLNGTHLNYVMMQGARMYPLTEIVDILKKGTETKIAAEFNTPLYLENYITIGHTINTEVLEPEVPVGFTLNQLKNLLIINGTSEKRDTLSMKIIVELIKAKVPSLIFDFDGTWSKMLTYFKNSRYEADILYFKYGSAFTIDPLTSDIPYDTENATYIEYMLDAFGLAFKKDEKIIDMFRNTIQKHSKMDLSAIRMALLNENEWEKTPIGNSLLSLFSDFTENDLTFLHPVHDGSIISSDFIQTEKTIIIDLSVQRELNKKMFLTFLIIAKIIHFIKNKKIEENFYRKVIVVPYIDSFFDSYHLDLKKNYDKIDLVLRPLLENEFGFIFTAHQIHNLYTNCLLYFNNIITFRAVDNRDIAILKNIMSLQELKGTGYYTSSRNNTYQIDYLKNMKNNEILIRREDINQPFPALIDWKKIQKIPSLNYESIVKFMKTQGYDLKFNERKILEQARETLFEIDLRHYFIYVDEIINFLGYVQKIDQIGNLYKQKLKKHLKEFLYSTLSKKTQKKEQMKKIRDNILDTLIKHEYLVENHPRRAGGGETLRTSYSVGDRYEEALEDYYKVKGRAKKGIKVEILEREMMNLNNLFPRQRKYIIPQEKLKDALMREFSDLNYDIFKIYSYIEKEEYSSALKIEHGLIKKFLINTYRQFYNLESVIVNDFNIFLSILEETDGFPFKKQEIIKIIDKCQLVKLEENLDSLTKELYQLIYDFFIKIQQYIYGE